ncbi:LysR substrate-binding domain-containing protein [Deinococcus sonorensis]|uniref:LysR substrate-binding domain-containing protein n=2 Tax=Deinococcus sonorensis TaxID=309891 RepID=A0ABV8YG33_9DEIO
MRRHTNLDMDVIRTLVYGVDLGSFSQAAIKLSRSPSAVSTQLKKLEAQLGTELLRKSGRGLVLTDAGEAFLVYARRLLELNDDAVAAVRGNEMAGTVRLGVQEDFGESLLPQVLGAFARTHPRISIQVRITRNADLLAGVNNGDLDLALAWGETRTAYVDSLATLPIRWFGPPDPSHVLHPPLPLAVFESPCLFRTLAMARLDSAGIPWRVTFTSPSLAGLWAALAAGLGVTPRTALSVPKGVRPLDHPDLPDLPSITLSLHRSEATASPVVERLSDLVKHTVLDVMEQRSI